MRKLGLTLKENSYTIHIDSNLLESSDLLTQYCVGDKVLIVSNDIVGPLYLKKLALSLNTKTILSLIISDGEIHKNRQSYFKILDYLVEKNFRRTDTLIALGGGVIGDLSGFVAASYQRGMNLLQIPTSLLAQVDSSVGGKTAINHRDGKNLIGAFYQPLSVIIDVDSLSTLPDREYFSGFGEIVKYALLGEQEILKSLHANLDHFLNRDKECLKEIIYLSCQKKAEIVARDEKEKGERALLNLGHTFAHALETLTCYKRYLHGEAVAIGILIAIKYSEKKGMVAEKCFLDYQDLFCRLNLPTRISENIVTAEFLSAMTKDKKNVSDSYRLVLVSEQGCVIQEETDKHLLSNVIQEFID